jgi:phosphopantothenate synthetase
LEGLTSVRGRASHVGVLAWVGTSRRVRIAGIHSARVVIVTLSGIDRIRAIRASGIAESEVDGARVAIVTINGGRYALTSS